MTPCSHLRFCRSDTTGLDMESSSSLGKGMSFTSTWLGPMNMTPRLAAVPKLLLLVATPQEAQPQGWRCPEGAHKTDSALKAGRERELLAWRPARLAKKRAPRCMDLV